MHVSLIECIWNTQSFSLNIPFSVIKGVEGCLVEVDTKVLGEKEVGIVSVVVLAETDNR